MAEKYNVRSNLVVIDVGGEKFHAKREIFLNFPTTRLGRLMSSNTTQQVLELCDEFSPSQPQQFFFDRNPETFAGKI